MNTVEGNMLVKDFQGRDVELWSTKDHDFMLCAVHNLQVQTGKTWQECEDIITDMYAKERVRDFVDYVTCSKSFFQELNGWQKECPECLIKTFSDMFKRQLYWDDIKLFYANMTNRGEVNVDGIRS